MMRFFVLPLLLLSGCGGSVLDGADSVPPRELPKGRTVGVFAPIDCVDRSGKPVTRPATRISVLLRDDSRPLLIEERPGYDALVVHNAFQAGNALVFQAISEPDDADPALHEYRVDWPEARGGQLVNAGAFEVTVQVGGGFRARASQLSLSCKLQREEPKPDLDKHGPVRYEEPEPPLPPSSDGKANG